MRALLLLVREVAALNDRLEASGFDWRDFEASAGRSAAALRARRCRERRRASAEREADAAERLADAAALDVLEARPARRKIAAAADEIRRTARAGRAKARKKPAKR